jgi:hypothetical protein
MTGITPSSRSASVASVNYSDPVGKTICYLQDNIGQFWLQYGFNPQTKAPVGTIGQNGSAINLGSWTTDVGLVQTARHCYAFYKWVTDRSAAAVAPATTITCCIGAVLLLYHSKSHPWLVGYSTAAAYNLGCLPVKQTVCWTTM